MMITATMRYELHPNQHNFSRASAVVLFIGRSHESHKADFDEDSAMEASIHMQQGK